MTEISIFQDPKGSYAYLRTESKNGSKMLLMALERPCLSLSDAKNNKPLRFRLQDKYQGMHFVDKDPEGENQYYEGKGAPLPRCPVQNGNIDKSLDWLGRNKRAGDW